jgi:hypothetical protein
MSEGSFCNVISYSVVVVVVVVVGGGGGGGGVGVVE